LIVKPNNPLALPRQVRDDEADPGEQLALVPFHFGHDATLAVPGPGLIHELVIPDQRLLWRTANGADQQVLNMSLQYDVRLQPNRIPVILVF
jgi:hypothetical protein